MQNGEFFADRTGKPASLKAGMSGLPIGKKLNAQCKMGKRRLPIWFGAQALRPYTGLPAYGKKT